MYLLSDKMVIQSARTVMKIMNTQFSEMCHHSKPICNGNRSFWRSQAPKYQRKTINLKDIISKKYFCTSSYVKGKKGIMYRLKTHTCGELNTSSAGEEVTLRGHLLFQRMGKFAVVRDFTGETQVLIRDENADLIEKLADTPFESYIEVKGKVFQRPEAQINKKMVTGEIEVVAEEFTVLSRAHKNLPFIIRNYNKAKEPLRLQYRYLDLRHKELQRNLRLRSQVAKRMRDYLQDIEGFIDLTTPTLSVSTPGGAKEFKVPTQHPGKFYSLVQSPQLYKQLAMIGGLDRYYQFAVCYRDEGAKPDRQPEFMQVDIEMANVTQAEVQSLIENMIVHSWPDHLPAISLPFPHMTYNEAMESYGVDKPDTRFDWKLQNVTELLKSCGVNILQKAVSIPGSFASAFVVPGGGKHINKKILSSWETLALKEHQLNGPSVLYVKEDGTFRGKVAKQLNEKAKRDLIEMFHLNSNDVVVLVVGTKLNVLSLLGKLRLVAAQVMEEAGEHVRNSDAFNFLWVVDFPLFELDEDSGRIASVHHPFTMPHPEDDLYGDPLKLRSQHYDIVLNGSEVGGGSIRIHDPSIQEYVFGNILGVAPESFGFFTEALGSGAPPHGGIALGFDRFIANLCGAPSIRDVIAFPKSMEGHCLMSGAPSSISKEDKELYHIETKSK